MAPWTLSSRSKLLAHRCPSLTFRKKSDLKNLKLEAPAKKICKVELQLSECLELFSEDVGFYTGLRSQQRRGLRGSTREGLSLSPDQRNLKTHKLNGELGTQTECGAGSGVMCRSRGGLGG